MSTGCLSCFKKKQSKKEDKPVKTERLPEPVREKEDVGKREGIQDKPLEAERLPEPVEKDVKNSLYKKGPYKCAEKTSSFKELCLRLPYAGSNNGGFDQPSGPRFDGELWGSISSSSMNNEFNKVKTFDIRGVTNAVAK